MLLNIKTGNSSKFITKEHTWRPVPICKESLHQLILLEQLPYRSTPSFVQFIVHKHILDHTYQPNIYNSLIQREDKALIHPLAPLGGREIRVARADLCRVSQVLPAPDPQTHPWMPGCGSAAPLHSASGAQPGSRLRRQSSRFFVACLPNSRRTVPNFLSRRISS